ncbi:F-box/LRR-repeat protein 6 [Pseudophryne corroboree]|uniref:F-box/LRR-repeat protein 6 n=1 Tax=Pseudophryne corroboree TaxID=495146 RepID=UPI003081C91A
MMSSSRGKSNASSKRSRRSGAAARKRRPYQKSGDSFYIQHTDKDMLFLISEDSGQVIRPPRRTEETGAAITTDSGWGSVMPLEILHRVFQLLVDSEGAVPSMCRVSQVCQRWYQVAASPILWRNVSVSVCWVVPTKKNPPNVQKKIQETVEMLIQKRLSQVSVFSLHHWSHHVPFILQHVSASCPHLTSLTLSHCSRVTADGLLSVAVHCPLLHSLNLQNSQVEPNTVSRFLEVCGARLKSLFLSHSFQINGIISKLAGGACPELRVLEVNTAMKFPEKELSVAIEALQASCPKLEVMRIMNLHWIPRTVSRSSPELPGFKDLQELCLANSTYSYTSDDICKRLLRDSTNLRVLDVRGCYRLTPAGICDFPCTDIERLYLGMYCSTMNSVMPVSGCYLMTRRWQHSLQELDLTAQSYSEKDLTQALDILARGGANDTLQSLNLAGTKVTVLSVKQMLSSCSALIHLDLTSCRNIPRGMKRVYRGEEDIRQCLSDLSTRVVDENGE